MEKSTISIEGRDYTLELLPPMQGASFGLRISSLLGGILGGILGDQSSEEGLSKFLKENKDNENAYERILYLFLKYASSFDPKEIEIILKEAMNSNVNCPNGKLSDPAIFDIWFAQHPGDLYPVGIWAAWEQAKPFFIGAAPGIKQVFGVAASKFQSQSQKAGSMTTSSQELPPAGSAPTSISKPGK